MRGTGGAGLGTRPTHLGCLLPLVPAWLGSLCTWKCLLCSDASAFQKAARSTEAYTGSKRIK